MPNTLHRFFLTSIAAPTQLARYRLTSIGLVMRYIFFFVALITASAFLHFLFGFTAPNSSLHTVKQYMTTAGLSWILYPFAFLFLFVSNTLLIMCHISLLTAVVFFIMKLYPVRLQFRQLWRVAALAMSWHYVLYIAAPFLDSSSVLYVLAFLVTLYATIRAAMHFPPARRAVAK